VLLLGFVAVYVLSLFHKDDPPPREEILDELAGEPVQTPTDKQPFRIEREGVIYTVTPLFAYELRGLVVSLHDSHSWWDYYHKRWGDNLNVRDLCVMWGGNALEGLYERFRFRSGSWTCYYNTSDNETWRRFDPAALSNNHLLTDGSSVGRRLTEAAVWDQVRLRGYLCEYSHDGGFRRGTSTVRTDRGNGACETVFVTDFEILRRANEGWRAVHWIATWGSIAMLLALVVMAFLSPPKLG
jgi:hypothetical protein